MFVDNKTYQYDRPLTLVKVFGSSRVCLFTQKKKMINNILHQLIECNSEFGIENESILKDNLLLY